MATISTSAASAHLTIFAGETRLGLVDSVGGGSGVVWSFMKTPVAPDRLCGNSDAVQSAGSPTFGDRSRLGPSCGRSHERSRTAVPDVRRPGRRSDAFLRVALPGCADPRDRPL